MQRAEPKGEELAERVSRLVEGITVWHVNRGQVSAELASRAKP
jgi:hypothetical protein